MGRLFGGIVAIAFGFGFAIILSRVNELPVDLSLPNCVAKSLILPPRPGHHGNKLAVPLRNLAKVLFSGELAVSHINEVSSL